MKLFNTLSRQVNDIKPLNPPAVTVYTCGPTVYDYAHIGHWFNYVRMDTLIRVLKLNGFSPKWVMNITDVGHLVSDADEGEDKLEKGAKREGKSAWEIADFYTQDFLECMKILNISEPNFIVKATDHIAEQIELIKILKSKGYAYIIDDGVYYDTSKFKKYADFAKLDLDNLEEGARIAQNTQKRNASDFALWKFSPKDHKRDMEWDSPWGKGFPGWHIECSAMSMKYLGDTLDIHTGGIDHIPIHHTNEIAQSEAVTDKPLANIWMHSNHLMVDGQKISKSLGNGTRLQTIISDGIPADAIRLLIMESNYRSQSNFSQETLLAAKNRLISLQAFADLRFQAIGAENSLNWPTLNQELVDLKSEFIESVSDDLQTPKALSLISILQSRLTNALIKSEIDAFVDLLQAIDQVFGLGLLNSQDITDGQKQLISKREEARLRKDFALSDELRDQLLDAGILLRDTINGPIWSRTIAI